MARRSKAEEARASQGINLMDALKKRGSRSWRLSP
jgi:hypothetical protein